MWSKSSVLRGSNCGARFRSPNCYEMGMTRTTTLTLVGIAALAATGMVGCGRTEVAAGPTPISNPPIASYADQAAGADLPTYTTVRPPVRTISSAPPAQIEVEPYDGRRTVSYAADRGTRTTRRRVRRNRPFSHSVAIVGGSAGAGALIGALAGGGKGAGLGALSEGGAGSVYVRLNHKSKE